jgi:uncharacterized protein YgiM (DUF1202 family)
MVAQSKSLFIGIGMLLLTILACQFGPPPPPTATNNDIVLTSTAVIQMPSTLTVSAPTAVTLLTETIPSVTDTPPEATAAPPTLTPTLTLSPTPSIPMVSVTTGTNCRSGPGQVYDIIGGAPVGVKFVIIGKSTPTDYWIIQLPDERECWLWGRYAVVEGDISSLPEYAIPPTPLPPVGSVAGTITNNVGDPLSNVKVTAQLAGRTFTTSSDGKYSFDNLATGPEYITVETSDYNPEFRSVNVAKGTPVTQDFVLVSFVPSGSLAKVQGRVLLNSNPAVGADVWVWGASAQGITDNSGRYLMDLQSGSYLILARLGNSRGGVEVSIPFDRTKVTTVTSPDIILLSR